ASGAGDRFESGRDREASVPAGKLSAAVQTGVGAAVEAGGVGLGARTRDAVEKVSHRAEYSRSVVSKSDFLSPGEWPDPAIRPAEQPSDRVLSCLLYQFSRSHQIISRCSEFQQPLHPFSSSQLDFAQ